MTNHKAAHLIILLLLAISNSKIHAYTVTYDCRDCFGVKHYEKCCIRNVLKHIEESFLGANRENSEPVCEVHYNQEVVEVCVGDVCQEIIIEISYAICII